MRHIALIIFITFFCVNELSASQMASTLIVDSSVTITEGCVLSKDGLAYHVQKDGSVLVDVNSSEYICNSQRHYAQEYFRKVPSGNIIIPEEIHYNGSVFPVVGIYTYVKPILYNPSPTHGLDITLFLYGKPMTWGFRDCANITSIKLPQTMSTIEACSFWGCKNMHSIEMDKTLIKTIEKFAFWECTSLKVLKFPKGLEEIGDSCFIGCKELNQIILPASVKYIGKDAFAECNRLTNITIDGKNPNFVVEDGILYDWEKTRLIACEYNRDIVIVPPTIKQLGTCFRNHDMFILNLPDGMTSIDDYAFSGCRNLTGTYIPPSVEKIGNSAFSKCANLSYFGVEGVISIGGFAFDGCANLEKIDLPSKLGSIGECSFRGTAIDSLYIPDNVEIISDRAFMSCGKLQYVSLPYSLLGKIDENVFEYCHALKYIEIRYPNGKKKRMSKNCKKLYSK